MEDPNFHDISQDLISEEEQDEFEVANQMLTVLYDTPWFHDQDVSFRRAYKQFSMAYYFQVKVTHQPVRIYGFTRFDKPLLSGDSNVDALCVYADTDGYIYGGPLPTSQLEPIRKWSDMHRAIFQQTAYPVAFETRKGFITFSKFHHAHKKECIDFGATCMLWRIPPKKKEERYVSEVYSIKKISEVLDVSLPHRKRSSLY